MSNDQSSEKWITSEIRQLIKAKSDYFRLYHLGIETFEQNNASKNKVTSKIRQAKHKKIHIAFQNYQSDTKNTWSLLKSSLSKSVDKCQIRITVNNVLITDEVDIANHFNEFFYQSC